MKLSSSVLLLSLVVGSGAASSVTAATQLRRTSAQTTPRGRRLKEPVGQCGACKKDDECLPGLVCVSATASGCFNFETDDRDSYCAPGPPTPSPVAATEAPAAVDAATATNTTSAPVAAGTTAPTDVDDGAAAEAAANTNTTSAPTDAAEVATPPPSLIVPAEAAVVEAITTAAPTTSAPTAAPTAAATTTAPTSAATTTAPTAAATTTAPTAAATPGATTSAPAPLPTYADDLRYIGSDPEIALKMCEGDCDSDADCEDDLVCLQRSGGGSVPGCGGTPYGDGTDYCVQPGQWTYVIGRSEAAPATSGAGRARRVGGMMATAVMGAAASTFLLGWL